MRGSQSTDYDWIIYDIIYILITLTGGSREPSPQANANKTLLLAGGLSSNGPGIQAPTKGLSFVGVKKRQGEMGEGRGRQRACDWWGWTVMERDGIADIS